MKPEVCHRAQAFKDVRSEEFGHNAKTSVSPTMVGCRPELTISRTHTGEIFVLKKVSENSDQTIVIVGLTKRLLTSN